jgi:hypothetical protein
LRNIYANFLNPIYNKKEVLIKSTDYDRTLQAAYALLHAAHGTGFTKKKAGNLRRGKVENRQAFVLEQPRLSLPNR